MKVKLSRRILAFMMSFVLLVFAACSNRTESSSASEPSSQSESTTPDKPTAEPATAATEPETEATDPPTEPKEEATEPPSSSSASLSEPSSPASNQSETPPQQISSEAQSSSPATNTAPTLDGTNFYGGIDDLASIRVEGIGMIPLNYEQATNLFGNISFAGLTPTDKDYQMDMYGPGESIVFIHPNFSHELRLDKETGVAMYQTGGQVYYYTFPDDEYTSISDFVMRAYKEISFPDAETDENGNLNVVTG